MKVNDKKNEYKGFGVSVYSEGTLAPSLSTDKLSPSTAGDLAQSIHSDYLGLDFFKAIKVGNVEWVRQLIEDGANPNIKDRYGETPLHISARSGHAKIIEILIAGGADVKAKDDFGQTPLHFAKWEKRKGAIKVLEAALEAATNKGK